MSGVIMIIPKKMIMTKILRVVFTDAESFLSIDWIANDIGFDTLSK